MEKLSIDFEKRKCYKINKFFLCTAKWIFAAGKNSLPESAFPCGGAQSPCLPSMVNYRKGKERT